jgi:hypothetical protein
MSHTHKCMSCGESWQCPQSPGDCKANESVLPSLVLRGPNGPQMFDHICQRKPRSETVACYAKPVAWIRPWDGDDSDIGLYVIEYGKQPPSDNHQWAPLYAEDKELYESIE